MKLAADESTNIIDKTTINAEAGTGANVNGSIIINNINTILVGLYFSKGRTIDVTGTDKNKITVFGTKGNDNISLNIKGDVEAKVDSGPGDDTVGFVQTSGKINSVRVRHMAVVINHDIADQNMVAGFRMQRPAHGIVKNDILDRDIFTAQKPDHCAGTLQNGQARAVFVLGIADPVPVEGPD